MLRPSSLLRSLPPQSIGTKNPVALLSRPLHLVTFSNSLQSLQPHRHSSSTTSYTSSNKSEPKRNRSSKRNPFSDQRNGSSHTALGTQITRGSGRKYAEALETAIYEPIPPGKSKPILITINRDDPTSSSHNKIPPFFLPKRSIMSSSHSHSVSPPHSSTTRDNSKRQFGNPEIQVTESGMILLIPLLAFLKSSAALNAVTLISRLALTLLPLSLRAKILHTTRSPLVSSPSTSGQVDTPPSSRKWVIGGETVGKLNAKILLPILVGLPVLLLSATIIASLERVAVTARWRAIMLGPEEEEGLVQSILNAGTTTHTAPNRPTFVNETRGTRDWISILNSVLQLSEEGRSAETGRRNFLGGEVLNGRDWRYRWTLAALRNLERGVGKINSSSDALGIVSSLDSPSTTTTTVSTIVPIPPPSHHPLRSRRIDKSISGVKSSAGEGLSVEYDLVVLERDEPNAFSFGFSPEVRDAGGRRGVIVVYTGSSFPLTIPTSYPQPERITGFLDEILGEKSTAPNINPSQKSSLFNIFSPSLRSTRPTPLESLKNPPLGLPTLEESRNLSVLLSHELSHLILSHTLESYASTSLLRPAICTSHSSLSSYSN